MAKDDSLAWAKCGAAWLVAEQAALCPAYWLAQRRCQQICLDLGLQGPAKMFESASAELESVCVQNGKSREPNLNVFGENDWDHSSRVSHGDPYIRALCEIAGVGEPVLGEDAPAFAHFRKARYSKVQELLDSSPMEWSAPALDLSFAIRTKVAGKTTATALPASKADRLIEASRELHAARQSAMDAKGALKLLERKAQGDGLSDLDALAVQMARRALDALAGLKACVAPADEVEVHDGGERFAPQKAFAIFLPGKGFYSSLASSHFGGDLCSARLFDSQKGAAAYFKRGRVDCAIVEVEIRIGAVKSWLGASRDPALESAAAQAEARGIEQALDRAGIEMLRERLAHLESKLAESEPTPQARPARSRL